MIEQHFHAPVDQVAGSNINNYGVDTWRNPQKDRLANRIALGAYAVLGLAGLLYVAPDNPATLDPAADALRSMLLWLCSALVLMAAACMAWRWRD